MKEPKWVLEKTVYAIHSEQIAEHGGRTGIRDEGLLKSALDAPKKIYQYESSSVFKLAAAYAFRINTNHPFIDGNKRTAFVTTRLFLIENGYDIEAPEKELAEVFLNIAANCMSENELSLWIEKNSKKEKIWNSHR